MTVEFSEIDIVTAGFGIEFSLGVMKILLELSGFLAEENVLLVNLIGQQTAAVGGIVSAGSIYVVKIYPTQFP